MKEGKSNLILIGMPAAGKSTVGVILAKELGYQFLDSDLLIQKREKMLLKDIIARKGTEGFLAVENAVNAAIEAQRTVIATGGSAVYGREAMKHLGEIEDEFDVEVEQEEAANIRTVQEAVDYLEKLTAEN